MDPAGARRRPHLSAPRPTAESLPTWLFGALVVAAGPLLLFHYGAYHWFLRDDWGFLTDGGDWLRDTYEPHGGSHWVAVPRLVYEGLWHAFGVTTYRPYQVFVITAHLAVVVMLQRIMRRAGVRPWLACAAAAVLVLCGPGETNTVWAFQLTINGSLAFGLGWMLLADHDGPFDRRDWLGLGCGLLAITCSGIGVTVVVAVAVSVLLRRGWRMALRHTVPLAALYGAWALSMGARTSTGGPDPALVLGWVRETAIGTFVALGRFPIAGWLLVAVLVVGMALVWGPWRTHPRREAAAEAAMPIGLFGAAIFFAASTALGRAWMGVEIARGDRYLYIAAALVLPLVAVAAEAVAARWSVLTPALVALFLLPIPFNLRDFDQGLFVEGHMAEREHILTTAVRMPFARDVPRDVEPVPDPYSEGVTIGFLLDAAEDGRLHPSTSPITPQVTNELRVRLGVAQRPAARSTTCRTHTAPVDLDPHQGDVLYLGSSVTVSTRADDRATSRPVVFHPAAAGSKLTIELPDLHLRVGPAPASSTFRLCERS